MPHTSTNTPHTHQFRNWLYVTPTTLHHRGGQSTHVTEFCQALARTAQVTLLAPAEHTFVAPRGTSHIPLHLPRYAKGIAFEMQVVRWMLTANLVPRPDIVYLRAGVFNASALLLARTYNVPCLMEINGDLVEEFASEYPATTPKERTMLRTRLATYRAALQWGYNAASGLIVVNPGLRDMAIQRYKVHPSRVEVIPNGANVYTFTPMRADVCRRRIGLPIERRYVGYVGSLTTWQDVPTLLKGFALLVNDHPDVDVLIVGDGATRSQIEDLVRQLGLEQRVHMVGAVPHEHVPRYLNACDITTVPKRLHRADSPLKVYEAMSCGIPILASRQSGVDVLTSENIGLLYEPEDASDLARQLNVLLRMSADDLVRMGARARRATEMRYSWDAVVERVRSFAAHVQYVSV